MTTHEERRRPTWDPWSFIPAEYNLGVALTRGQVEKGHGAKPALLRENAAGATGSLTYAGLDVLSNRLADSLTRLGVRHGERVFLRRGRRPGHPQGGPARAEHVEAQVRAMLALSGREPPPVLRVSARTGAGVEEFWAVITAPPPRRPPTAEVGRDLLRLAEETLRTRFAAAEAAGDPGLRQLIADWQAGRLSGPQAAAALWRLLDDSPAGSRRTRDDEAL